MSIENIVKFQEAVNASPELQEKILLIRESAAKDAGEKIVALSVETGTPFTAEEYLQAMESPADELSEEQLEAVAGGGWNNSGANIMGSIFLPLTCLGRVVESLTGHRGRGQGVEHCQMK